MSFPNPEGGNERPKNRPEVSPDNDSNDTGNGDNALDSTEDQDSIDFSANLKLAEDLDDNQSSNLENLEVSTSSEGDQLSDRVENQQGLKERLSSNKLEIDSSRLALRSSFDFSELLAKQLITDSSGSEQLSSTLDSSIENEEKHVSGLTDTRVDRAVLLIGSGTDLGIHNGELQLARLVKDNPSLQVDPDFRDKVTDAYLKMAQNRDPNKPVWQSQLKASDLIPNSENGKTPLSSSQIIEGIEGGFKAYENGGLDRAAPKFDQLIESVEQGHNQNLNTSLGLFIDGLKQDALIAQSKGGNLIQLQETRNKHLEQETVASQRAEQSKDLLVPLSVSYALMKISDGGPETVREGKLKLLEHQDHNPEIALDVRFQSARIRAFGKHFDSNEPGEKGTEEIESSGQTRSTDTANTNGNYFSTKDIVSHFSSDQLETIPLRSSGKPDWKKITQTDIDPIDTFRNLLAMETGVEVKQKVNVPPEKREEIKNSLKSLFLDDYESPAQEEKAVKEELAKHDIPTLEQIAQEEIDELTRSVPEKDYGEATTPSLYDRAKYPVLTAMVAYGGYQLLKQGGKFIFGKKPEAQAEAATGADTKVEQRASSNFYNELESPKERETSKTEPVERANESKPTEEVRNRETEIAVPREVERTTSKLEIPSVRRSLGPERKLDLVVLHFNDMHSSGLVDGEVANMTEVINRRAQEAQRQGKFVLVIQGGDEFSGNTVSNYTGKGLVENQIVEEMKRLTGLDFTQVIGNHAVDGIKKIGHLVDIAEKTNGTFSVSNLEFDGRPDAIGFGKNFEPFRRAKAVGPDGKTVDIAVVGLTTHELTSEASDVSLKYESMVGLTVEQIRQISEVTNNALKQNAADPKSLLPSVEESTVVNAAGEKRDLYERFRNAKSVEDFQTRATEYSQFSKRSHLPSFELADAEKGNRFTINDSYVHSAWDAVESANKKGIERVIIASHLGFEAERTVAKNVPGVALIVGAHSHDALARPNEVTNRYTNEKVAVTQAGAKAQFLGETHVEYRANEFTVKGGLHNIRDVMERMASQDMKPEAARQILKFISERYQDGNPANPRIVDKLAELQQSERFGIDPKNPPKVEGTFSDVNIRKGETNIGNLTADAMRAALSQYQRQNEGPVLNGFLKHMGDVRNPLKQGMEINGLTLSDVFCNGHESRELIVTKMTPMMLKDALEFGVHDFPKPGQGKIHDYSGNLLLPSGMRVEYDTSKEGAQYNKASDSKDAGKPTHQGDRIRKIEVFNPGTGNYDVVWDAATMTEGDLRSSQRELHIGTLIHPVEKWAKAGVFSDPERYPEFAKILGESKEALSGEGAKPAHERAGFEFLKVNEQVTRNPENGSWNSRIDISQPEALGKFLAGEIELPSDLQSKLRRNSRGGFDIRPEAVGGIDFRFLDQNREVEAKPPAPNMARTLPISETGRQSQVQEFLRPASGNFESAYGKAEEVPLAGEVDPKQRELAPHKESLILNRAHESGLVTAEVVQNLKDKPVEARDFVGYAAEKGLSKNSVQELSKLSGSVLAEFANPRNIETTQLYLAAMETGMVDSSTIEKIFDAKMMERVSVETDGQKGTTSGRHAIERLMASNMLQQNERISKGSIANLTSLSPQEVVSFVEKFGGQKVEAINKLASEPRALKQTLESLQLLESNNSSREIQFRSSTGGLDTTIRSMVAEGKLTHEAIKAYDFALSRGQLTAQGLSDLLKQTKDVKLIETFNQSLIEQSKEVVAQTRSQAGGAVLDPRSVRSSDFQSGQLEQGSRGDLNIARGRSGEVVQENRFELEKRSLETAIERERAKGNKEVVERLEALKKDMETNKEARERLRGMAREKGMSLEKLHSGGWLILASTAMTYLIFANLQEVEQRGGTSTISGTRRGG